MPTDLVALADKVRQDSVSGSSEAAAYVLRSLHEILSNNEPGKEQLQEFAGMLRKAKPAMAPLSNIALMLEAAANVPDPDKAALLAVEKIINNERSAGTRIAERAMELIEGTVLTLSYSGTVMTVLRSAAKKKMINVIVAESFPLGEGRSTADLLSKEGIEVTLVADSMVFAEARNADLCMVGADAITPHALINKVGTYGAALASMQAGIPTYVVSSTLKVTTELRPDWIVEQKTKGKLVERTQLFEPTPLELIAQVITELGASKPGLLF